MAKKVKSFLERDLSFDETSLTFHGNLEESLPTPHCQKFAAKSSGDIGRGVNPYAGISFGFHTPSEPNSDGEVLGYNDESYD